MHKIALGITGSLAAIETVKIARELKRQGYNVVAVLSESAKKIIGKAALECVCDEVIEEIRKAEHVKLLGENGEASALLIAPATANTISKFACGIADTPVTLMALTALGSGKPVLIAPAMHISLYRAINENLESLKKKGVFIIPPRIEENKAKIAHHKAIVLCLEKALSDKPMNGKKVVVTSGPTYEFIDPIRFISNKSSGKMGNALAVELWKLGAEVVLVSSSPLPFELPELKRVKITSVFDMLHAVLDEIKTADLFVCAAAPSDFIPAKRTEKKIKTQEKLCIELKEAPKIVKEVRKVWNGDMIVFKAETGISERELEEIARKKLSEDNALFVVACDVMERGMGTEDIKVVVVGKDFVKSFEGKKEEVARKIVSEYVSLVKK